MGVPPSLGGGGWIVEPADGRAAAVRTDLTDRKEPGLLLWLES
jgi:hypothetical protein